MMQEIILLILQRVIIINQEKKGYGGIAHGGEKNKLIFKNKNITKIITNCPACAKIFKKYYHIETEYIAETIANNIRKLEFEKENKEQEQIKDTISLHIPCYLMKNTELIKKVKKPIKF